MNHFTEMLKITLILTTIIGYVQCECPPGTPGPVLSITSPTEQSNTTYSGHGPITLICQGTGDTRTTVDYFRGNGDGITKTIHIPKQSNVSYVVGTWIASVNENPPPEKFPYTYYCVASHPCYPNVTAQFKNADSVACTDKELRLTLITYISARDKSADVAWVYHVLPGDTGFIFSWSVEEKYDGRKHDQQNNLEVTATNYSISGLVPNVEYIGSLEVLYGYNCSSQAQYLSFKTEEEGCPFFYIDETSKAIHSNVSQTSAVISWQHPLGQQINGFILSWWGGRMANGLGFNRTTTQFKITGLVPYTFYTYRWGVKTGITCITAAEDRNFTTLTDVPGIPRDLRAKDVNSTTIDVTWTAPEFPNGPNLYYRIFYKEKTHTQYQIINVTSGLFRQRIYNLSE